VLSRQISFKTPFFPHPNNAYNQKVIAQTSAANTSYAVASAKKTLATQQRQRKTATHQPKIVRKNSPKNAERNPQ
jgi:hypothetical protein